MVYVWEFEFFESGGRVDAFPCGDMPGATFGDDLYDAMESAADLLVSIVDEHLMRGEALPEVCFGHCPEHGGRIIAVAVSRKLGDIPAVTAADAARELGVSRARVSQLISAGLLESWKDGAKRMVSRDSVDARKAELRKGSSAATHESTRC